MAGGDVRDAENGFSSSFLVLLELLLLPSSGASGASSDSLSVDGGSPPSTALVLDCLRCLLTLLVERSKEGVSFMFPFLQSRQIFRLSLARLPKLASICNLVVISGTALESPVYLVDPGFVI